MLLLIGPLVLGLMLQATTGSPVTGLVVDAKGLPVAGAEVALAAGMTRDGSVPVLSQTRSDQAGKFHFPRPAPEKLASVDTTLTLWAHKPGLALGVVDLLRSDRRDQVHRLVLEAACTAPADDSRRRWKTDRGRTRRPQDRPDGAHELSWGSPFRTTGWNDCRP